MSFQQGLSGLNASSKNLEVIGNNVANANTFGSKASRAEFADVYAERDRRRRREPDRHRRQRSRRWRSSSRRATSPSTDNPLDLAINGAGFFQVTDGTTRRVHPQRPVQGRPRRLHRQQPAAAADGLPGRRHRHDPSPASAAALQHADRRHHAGRRRAGSRSSSTSTRARRSRCRAAGAPIDFTDPTTYNNATSVTVYDAKGQDVALTYYFQKAATDTWNVYVTANGTPISTVAAACRRRSTTLTFPPNGGAPTAPVGTVPLDIPSVTNAAGARHVPIAAVALERLPARRSSARSSASPTCRRTATRRAS